MAAALQSWRSVQVPWRAPLRAAHPSPAESAGRKLELLRLDDGTGHRGFGEAAPLPGYTGSDPAAARAAALDMATLDLQGRAANLPVWRLLGAATAVPVPVNATIGAEPPSVAATLAEAAAVAGYRTIKVKVGIGAGDDDGVGVDVGIGIGIGDDVARVAAVRAAVGPSVAIRLDANGAWSVADAVEHLRALAVFEIELCEEPVHGAAALATVAAALPALAIAADESAAELLAAGPLAGSRSVVRAVCLKVARGGITALVRDAARARALGLEVYLASTLDGPIGIAAALHAAAVITPDRACGLATLDRFDREPPFAPHDGVMVPPDGPGLGDGLVDWYVG